jgi:hypothetical protein
MLRSALCPEMRTPDIRTGYWVVILTILFPALITFLPRALL